MKEPTVRDYARADYESLCALWSETGVGNPARGDTAESIDRTLDSGGRLIVLDLDGNVVGSCWLTDDARRLYIHHMAVTPSLQGNGLGARLVAEAVNEASKRGLQMKLEVHAENTRAMALYRKFGFAEIGDFKLMLKRK